MSLPASLFPLEPAPCGIAGCSEPAVVAAELTSDPLDLSVLELCRRHADLLAWGPYVELRRSGSCGDNVAWEFVNMTTGERL